MGLEISYDSFKESLVEAIKSYIKHYNRSIASFYVESYLANNVPAQILWNEQLKTNPDRKIALGVILTVIRFLDASSLSSEDKTQILLALVCYIRSKIRITYEGSGLTDMLMSMWTDVNQSQLFFNLGMILPQEFKSVSLGSLRLLKEFILLKDFIASKGAFIFDETKAFEDILNLAQYKSRPVTPENDEERVMSARAASPAETGLFSKQKSFLWNSDANPATTPSFTE